MITASSFRIHDFSDGGRISDAAALAEAVARTRGCATDAEVAEFLGGAALDANPVAALAAYRPAADRLKRAIAAKETISIFGDYDVDGMTSVVLMFDLLRSAGHAAVRIYIPDRATEDYGLTLEATQNCFRTHSPKLVFTVDCGSNSVESIRWLREQGVDTIVLDHHGVHVSGEHPAVAHLNPKADPAETPLMQDLRTLSAAGLAYLFCRQFASELPVPEWPAERAAILGGLGTMVDVMPLRGINRQLVRRSLELAGATRFKSLPGLAALAEAAKVDSYTARTYSHTIGPHLNASGRVSTAKIGVSVLANRTDLAKAEAEAAQLVLLNTERKATQAAITREARVQAQELLLAHPSAKVLLLADARWHAGVVGIVASRIREDFGRPTFVCGRNDEGFWKGSGRSVPGFDLGALVAKAVAAKVVIGGGGHAAAAGVKLSGEQLAPFMHWLDEATRDLTLDSTPTYEVLGAADARPADEWLSVLARLEPFGNGNPECHLILEASTLVDGPTPLKRNADQAVWALCASFETRLGRIKATWRDLDAATAAWCAGGRYRLVLNLSRTSSSSGRQYINWNVVACEPVEG